MKALSDIVVLLFVLSSVFNIGLQLRVSQIQAPLRDPRLILLALLANFVAVPVAAVVMSRAFQLDEPQSTGLILLGSAGGAPFFPKLVASAKGDLALATSLMVLLMIGSLACLPLVLPILLPGVSVNSARIGQSLFVTMIVPLAIGVLIKARFETATRWLLPLTGHVSNATLVTGLILISAMNFTEVLDLVRTRGLPAGLLFVVAAFGCGYALAPTPSSRAVLGLGTAARNIPAALLIGTQNFRTTVTTTVIVFALGSLFVLVPLVIGIRHYNRSTL